VWWLLAIYVTMTAVTLVAWSARGVYGLSGDEPHYLVMADALLTGRGFDVTEAYLREFATPQFYPPGLTAVLDTPDASGMSALVPPAAHVVVTDAGVFSWHGWGTALLAVIVLPWAGIFGVKALTAVAGVLVVVAAWTVSARGPLAKHRGSRALAVATVALGYPVLLASTQVFPDLWAGALLLAVLAWLLASPAPPGRLAAAAAGLALGFLPWLGVKFAPAVLVLALFALWRVRGRRGWLAGPVLLLWAALGAYHVWAFGSPFGPPLEGTLAFGPDFWMVLPGLLFDQNQGALLSNPILWAAIPGIVLLWRSDRALTAAWTAVFLAVWIPGAAHPGLYGLGSFNGRYSWALSCLLVIPALLALGALRERAPRLFLWVVGVGLLFNAYLYALGTFIGGANPGMAAGLDLYTKPAGTWLESYSAWWFPLQDFLPAWYDREWAFGFLPNWVWLTVGVAVLICVAVRASVTPTRIAGVVAGAAVIVGGIVSTPGLREETEVWDVTVTPASSTPGYPVVGPTRAMRWGPYSWFVEYSAAGSGPVGKWELVRVLDDVVVASGELQGSDGRVITESAPVPFRALIPREFVLRVGWYATEPMTIRSSGVRHGSS